MLVLRNILLAILCGGLLVPVISTADDLILLSADIERLTPDRPDEFRDRAASMPSDSSEAFWVQFEHMDCPARLVVMPAIGRAGTVTLVERALVSVVTPQRAVRGPPLSAIA